MRPHLLLAAFVALLLAATAGPASAHKPSDAYLALTLEEPGAVRGQWDIALRDLENVVGLDANADGAITWGELKGGRDAVTAYALARLTIAGDDHPCALAPEGILVDYHTDGAYAVLRFLAACTPGAETVTVGYRLFADIDPTHRGLLRVEDGGVTRTAVLGPDTPTFAFARSSRPSLAGQAFAYLREGVWHILHGYDHILFLLSLLLPAVLRREGGRWHAVPSFREALLDTARIVTTFTVAHSITLGLAAAEVVSPPSRLVESAIALTIVLAALNNLRPVVTRRIWMVAFGFGLIHGLGFAGALRALGLPRGDFALSLLSFNLGVECGQLAIVALFLPVAFALRSTPLYPRLALQAGSLAVVALATVWFLQRAFDLALIR